MSQDNRLLPLPTVERGLERPLSDLPSSKSYGRPYGVSPSEPTNLRDYLFVVLKRKWLILSLVLVITSLVTVHEYRQPSIYEAATTIKIEQKPKSVLQTKEVIINGQADPNFWGTQLRLLQSPTLARQVALTLDLQHNPNYFGGSGAQTGIYASLRRIFGRETPPPAAPAPLVGTEPQPIVKEADMEGQSLTPEQLARLEPYEDTIIGNETVEPIPGTNLVIIRFHHTDPEIAQKVANTLADVFVDNNYNRLTSGSGDAQVKLAKEIAKLQAELKHDNEVKFNYAKAHNLPLEATADNLEAQKLRTLAMQLLEAGNVRKDAQAQYEAARDSPDIYSVPDVQNSLRITKLREKIADLKERRAALLVTYTEEWPEVKKIDEQIKQIQADLTKAPTEVVSSLKSRYESAVARENSLRASYNQQRGTTTQQTQDEIELVAINQRIETNKQYLNTLLQRQQEIQVTSSDQSREVSVMNYSRVPGGPIGPQRTRNIMIAFLLSLISGIGLAFLLDFLDDTVKTVEDVDRYIHLPALALIPASRNERSLRLKGPGGSGTLTGGESTALALIDDVRSPIAESYRHLRTSLLLSSAGQPPKTILVTSSQPSEGKTTTAVNTAVMLAQTGAEVLIVDCDLRRPRLHAHFEVGNTRGLTNYLSGESNLDELLQPYEKLPNLKLLTSGPVPPNPAELLGSDEMRKLLGLLGERFTHIIIDSPPAISFTDASILSTMVDGVMLVVHGGRSSRAVVRRAKQQLTDVGAHIFGVVLNNVKLESQDYYYYAGYYSNYYTEADGSAPDAP